MQNCSDLTCETDLSSSRRLNNLEKKLQRRVQKCYSFGRMQHETYILEGLSFNISEGKQGFQQGK